MSYLCFSKKRRLYGCYRFAILALGLQTVLAVSYGHLGPNARIYEFFARLSDSGVDIFDQHALPRWEIAWSYLDFTPFNLLLYKVIFFVKGTAGDRLFRLYECAYLFLALLCIRTLASRASINRSQELCLIALTAFNPLLVLLTIYSADDKTGYFALPLLLITLGNHPRLQAFLSGLWSAWSGVGLLFLPAFLIRFLRDRGQRAILLVMLALGLALALLPWFPHSLVLVRNRSLREAAPPFWFSVWRLAGSLYFPGLNRFVLTAYGLVVSGLYGFKRLPFAPALVAVCLSYCLLSNNTVPGRILTTLFLALLFTPSTASSYRYTAGVFLFEILVGLGRVPGFAALGFLNPDTHSGTLMILNVALVNAVPLFALILTLSMWRSPGRTYPAADFA